MLQLMRAMASKSLLPLRYPVLWTESLSEAEQPPMKKEKKVFNTNKIVGRSVEIYPIFPACVRAVTKAKKAGISKPMSAHAAHTFSTSLLKGWHPNDQNHWVYNCIEPRYLLHVARTDSSCLQSLGTTQSLQKCKPVLKCTRLLRQQLAEVGKSTHRFKTAGSWTLSHWPVLGLYLVTT